MSFNVSGVRVILLSGLPKFSQCSEPLSLWVACRVGDVPPAAEGAVWVDPTHLPAGCKTSEGHAVTAVL